MKKRTYGITSILTVLLMLMMFTACSEEKELFDLSGTWESEWEKDEIVLGESYAFWKIEWYTFSENTYTHTFRVKDYFNVSTLFDKYETIEEGNDGGGDYRIRQTTSEGTFSRTDNETEFVFTAGRFLTDGTKVEQFYLIENTIMIGDTRFEKVD